MQFDATVLNAMVFDFNLNLRVSSGSTLHTLNRPKELNLMSWIAEFAIDAREEDDKRDRRENAYEQQMGGVWNSLVSRVRLDVEALNQHTYLLTHRLRGEKLIFEQEDDSSFKVSRMTIPSAYLTVTNRHRYFEVERKGRTTVDSELSHEPIEKIQLEANSDFVLYMSIPKTGAGALSFSDISRHLLQPMLSVK